MEQTQGYIETPFFASLKNWFYDLVQGDPETPDRQDKLGGKKQKRPESKMKTRNKVYKVSYPPNFKEPRGGETGSTDRQKSIGVLIVKIVKNNLGISYLCCHGIG